MYIYLQDSFGPASIPWAELGQPPPPVLFVLSGRGEASVTLGLEFVPAELRPAPVSRGIEVRKVTCMEWPSMGGSRSCPD